MFGPRSCIKGTPKLLKIVFHTKVVCQIIQHIPLVMSVTFPKKKKKKWWGSPFKPAGNWRERVAPDPGGPCRHSCRLRDIKLLVQIKAGEPGASVGGWWVRGAITQQALLSGHLGP